jgi:hypothetical protein
MNSTWRVFRKPFSCRTLVLHQPSRIQASEFVFRVSPLSYVLEFRIWVPFSCGTPLRREQSTRGSASTPLPPPAARLVES